MQPEAAPVRWLDDEEAATWRAYLAMTTLLQRRLDTQLQADAGMPHAYYAILARLSERPESTARVTDLATALDFSQSRTSHALTRLEEAGWIARKACETDRRTTFVVLTDEGHAVLADAAPGHVACVRENFLDHLSAAQLGQLRRICDATVAHLVAGESCD